MNDEQKPKVSTAPISLTTVSSSQIEAIGHDATTSTLAIKFASKGDKPGPVYHYGNFGADQFKKFQEAESKGAFFGANVKNNVARHPYVRIS